MNVYLISYDLFREGQDYDGLISAIRSYPEHCHALASQWFICSEDSAETIYDNLRPFTDKDDYLLVSALSQNQAGRLSPEAADWLEEKFLSPLGRSKHDKLNLWK